MSVFRPLNSDESNLFTIRISVKPVPSEAGDLTLISAVNGSLVETYLESPTVNNLPTGFKLELIGNLDYYRLTYGKKFTSAPCITFTPKSTSTNVKANNAQTTETLIPNIVQNNQFDTADAGADKNCLFCFRQAIDGTPVQAINGFEMVITGPIRVGVTTGNSNKGWSIGSGNDATTIYTYLSTGINKGNPGCTLDVNGGIRSGLDTVTAATLTLTELDSGKTIVLNKADGITVTLPAATGTNNRFFFVVQTTITSNNTIIQVVNSSDIFIGSIINVVDSTSESIWPSAGDSDTITLNGTTTGGIAGDYFEIIDIATGIFFIKALSKSTGTAATPFSAAV